MRPTLAAAFFLLCAIALPAAAQIVFPRVWQSSSGAGAPTYYNHVTMDTSAAADSLHVIAFGAIESGQEWQAIADRFDYDTGWRTRRAIAFESDDDPHVSGGMNAAGDAFLVGRRVIQNWDASSVFTFHRILPDGWNTEEIYTWFPLDPYVWVISVGVPVLAHSNGQHLSSFFLAAFDHGSGWDGVEMFRLNTSSSGSDASVASEDYHSTTFRDYCVSDLNQHYLVSYHPYGDWNQDPALARIKRWGAWGHTLSDDANDEPVAVVAIPSTLGGGMIVCLDRDFNACTLFRYTNGGSILWELDRPYQGLSHACLSQTGHLVTVDSDFLRVHTLDGEQIDSSSVVGGRHADRIVVSRDGGFLVACNNQSSGWVMRIAGGEVELDLDDDLIPSDGGELAGEIILRTGLISEQQGTATLTLRSEVGSDSIQISQPVALVHADTTVFNPTLDIPASFPDGDLTAAVRVVSDDGRFELVTTQALVKGGVGVDDPELPEALAGSVSPATFTLAPVRPNPFNGSATVTVTLPHPGHIRVALFDLLGREVAAIHDGPLSAGTHNLALNAATLPSGVYLLRAEHAGETVTQRVTLVK